jgi:hypothetical protein
LQLAFLSVASCDQLAFVAFDGNHHGGIALCADRVATPKRSQPPKCTPGGDLAAQVKKKQRLPSLRVDRITFPDRIISKGKRRSETLSLTIVAPLLAADISVAKVKRSHEGVSVQREDGTPSAVLFFTDSVGTKLVLMRVACIQKIWMRK